MDQLRASPPPRLQHQPPRTGSASSRAPGTEQPPDGAFPLREAAPSASAARAASSGAARSRPPDAICRNLPPPPPPNTHTGTPRTQPQVSDLPPGCVAGPSKPRFLGAGGAASPGEGEEEEEEGEEGGGRGEGAGPLGPGAAAGWGRCQPRLRLLSV